MFISTVTHPLRHETKSSNGLSFSAAQIARRSGPCFIVRFIKYSHAGWIRWTHKDPLFMIYSRQNRDRHLFSVCNSFWSCDALWRHTFGPILFHVMVCHIQSDKVFTMMIMRGCNVQTNEYDLQAKTYPNICTHHKLHNTNENKFPVFPECIYS